MPEAPMNVAFFDEDESAAVRLIFEESSRHIVLSKAVDFVSCVFDHRCETLTAFFLECVAFDASVLPHLNL